METKTTTETISADDVKRAFDIMLAVAEIIRTAGEIPNGHLYSAVMGRVNIDGYNAMLRNLKNAKLIEEKNHLLRWIGPKF